MDESTVNQSRRDFLKAALLTSGAAVATGTGAALLWPAEKTAVPVTHTVANAGLAPGAGLSGVTSAAVGPSVNPTELMERLAASQAENMRLQAELNAALRRLEMSTAVDSQPNEAVLALQDELQTANAQLSSLAGLVALYEELERIDVQGLFTQGTTAVSNSFQTLLDQLPTLREGVDAGHAALNSLEGQLPLLENGRSWLETHRLNLAHRYELVEQVLHTAVRRAGPLLEMLQAWFDDILKWLPFGMGENARQVMNALTDYIQQGPTTLHGLDTNIAQPLDTWLKREPGQQDAPLVQNIVKPVRERALQPATQAIAQAEAAHAVYQEQLVAQLEAQLAGRESIQQLIAAYRQENGV